MMINKSKFLLSTRNDFTGKAINNVDSSSIKELLNGKSSYMHCENSYLRRRFDGNDLFDSQERFDKFCKIHNGDKPLLILDVDNTMLYVRFFSDEMSINDIVTYFGDSHFKNNATVLKLLKTLHLEIIDGQLIDKLGTEHTQISLWIEDNDTLQKYKKGATYAYNSIQCKILKTEVIGCIIAVKNTELNFVEQQPEEYEDNSELQTQSITQIEISFVDENEHLSKLEPALNRPGMLPIDFIYEGFLVRLRPNLDEFLEYASEDFDIVIFTAATKDVYNGMLSVLHEYVKDQLGRDDEHDLQLWTDILFREDCTLKNEKTIKPYHHKDLTLFGCHLSRTVMVDNSPVVVSGQEPNVILIQDFFGKDEADDELMEVYRLLDAITEIKGDIRYFLCDIDPDAPIANMANNEDKKLDFSTQQSCQQITIEFIDTLKKEFKRNNEQRISVSYRYSLSQKIPTLPMQLIAANSTPIYSQWAEKCEKRQEKLRAKFKQKHKSLLTDAGFGKFEVKRHRRYSSMRPKIEDFKNFDIEAVEEDMEHQEINEIDSKLDLFDDITDDEDGDDEYMLIDPLLIKKPKIKNIQVKFTKMTEIMGINEISDSQHNCPESPIRSDTKPLIIELAMVDESTEPLLTTKKENTEYRKQRRQEMIEPRAEPCCSLFWFCNI